MPTMKETAAALRHAQVMSISETTALERLGLPRPVKGKPERYSASTLNNAGSCLLSHKLKRMFDASGPPAVLGHAAHEVFAQLVFMARMQGRSTFTADEAEKVARKVARAPDEADPLSRSQYVDLLAMARHWSGTASFHHDADVFLVEQFYETPLPTLAGIIRLSARLDHCAIDGTVAQVDDWKTGVFVPTQQEVEDEHVQLPIYAWHLWNEYPWLDTFILREHYVRRGVRREVMLSLDDVVDLEDYLMAIVERLETAWAKDEFPATPGRHCGYCPAPQLCPLPREAKPSDIRTEQEAREQADALAAEEASVKKRKAALRTYLDTRELERIPGTRVGVRVKSARQLDKKTLGTVVDLDAYTSVKVSTELATNLTPDQED